MYSILHVTLFRVQIGYNLCIKTGRGIRMFLFFLLCAQYEVSETNGVVAGQAMQRFAGSLQISDW